MYPRLRICALALLLGPLTNLPAVAADGPLSLASAEQQALERDESLRRYEAQVAAMRHRAVADGALPDPQISLGVQNLPVDSFSLSDDMMTMLMVGVRQSFPAGRTRHLQRERGDVQARAAGADYDNRRLEVQREVRNAWLDWRVAIASLAVAQEARDAFADLSDIVERRFAAGTARARDRTQARLELAALDERLIELEARRDAAAAELARWLDKPVRLHTQPGAAQEWRAPPPLPQLRDALAGHPSLQASALRTEAGTRSVDIAREAYKPAWMVELGYGHRRLRDPMGDGRASDKLSGMVSLSVPLFTGNRQDQRLDAAQRDEAAARADYSDRLRQLQGQLERHHALWHRFEELSTFYDRTLLDEARQLVDGTEAAYRRDRATFDELIRAHIAEFEQRLRQLRVQRDRDAARVELLYLAGE